jgi:hypothetical protein
MSDSISRRFDLMVPHGQLNECIAQLEEGMQALNRTPYHEVLGRKFLHHTDAAADYLIRFHRNASKEIDVAAIYFEMNGFTINPSRWFFDGFAYKTAGELWDLDWLASWDADAGYEQFTLTGMELVQNAFANCYRKLDPPLSLAVAADFADHLVTARFMELIAAAHEAGKATHPTLAGLLILATAHDWETVHQTR